MNTFVRVRGIAAWVIGFLLLAAAVLALMAPGSGRSYVHAFGHWLWLLPVTISIWAALEWGGDRFLSLRFWQRLPPAVRVPLLALLGAAVLFAFIALE
jgi:hypothetical protein